MRSRNRGDESLSVEKFLPRSRLVVPGTKSFTPLYSRTVTTLWLLRFPVEYRTAPPNVISPLTALIRTVREISFVASGSPLSDTSNPPPAPVAALVPPGNPAVAVCPGNHPGSLARAHQVAVVPDAIPPPRRVSRSVSDSSSRASAYMTPPGVEQENLIHVTAPPSSSG